MRAGRVVRIRVNPQDCMGVVDVVTAAGMITPGMSFATVVSVALHVLLNSVRGKAIPDRDGFEYSEMMQPYGDQPHLDRARKLDIAETVFAVQGRPKPEVATRALDPARQRKERRMKELVAKREADPMNFGTSEQAELQQLADELIAGL